MGPSFAESACCEIPQSRLRRASSLSQGSLFFSFMGIWEAPTSQPLMAMVMLTQLAIFMAVTMN